jgi:hypothetical protein
LNPFVLHLNLGGHSLYLLSLPSKFHLLLGEQCFETLDALLLLFGAPFVQQLQLLHASQVALHLALFAGTFTLIVLDYFFCHPPFLRKLKLCEDFILLQKQFFTLIAFPSQILN